MLYCSHGNNGLQRLYKLRRHSLKGQALPPLQHLEVEKHSLYWVVRMAQTCMYHHR